jgi:hypothetical protein
VSENYPPFRASPVCRGPTTGDIDRGRLRNVALSVDTATLFVFLKGRKGGES